MYKNILVLDAGHGGSDSGATGNRLREKDLTLSIVLAAKKQFDKDKNYAVYYTRTTDTYPSLTDRSDLATTLELITSLVATSTLQEQQQKVQRRYTILKDIKHPMELHPISGQLMYITLQRQQQDLRTEAGRSYWISCITSYKNCIYFDRVWIYLQQIRSCIYEN